MNTSEITWDALELEAPPLGIINFRSEEGRDTKALLYRMDESDFTYLDGKVGISTLSWDDVRFAHVTTWMELP